MLNVVDCGRESLLKGAHNTLAHFFGRKAAVTPDDANDRNAYLWQDVRRRRAQHKRRGQQNQQRHHQIGVRAPERNIN